LLRVSADEVAATFAKLTPRTNEQEEAAQKYIEGLVNLGETWDELKNKVATPLFPWLTSEMEKMERYQQQWDDFLKWVDSKKTAAGTLGAPVQMPPPPLPPAFKPPFVPTPPGSTVPGLPGAVFKFADMGGGGKYDDFLSALPFPNAEGQIEDRRGEGGDGSGAQRIVKAGVFEALVDFQSYAQAGAGGGRAQFFGGGATGGMGASGGVGGGGAIGGGGLGAGSGGGGGINIPGGIGGAAGPTGGAGSAGDRDGRPSGPGSVGAGTGGAAPRGSGGGSGGITAPAGTAITKTGLATVTTPSGKQFKVDARYAQNFKGFLSDYEKAGGVLGPDTGSLGFRPRNASGHPIGAAIDVNQIGYGVRSKRGTSLAPDVEDALAAKWGMVSGHQWRRPDTGHFGIRNFEAARQALIKNGVEPGKASEIAAQSSGGPGNGTTVKGSVFGSGFGFGTDRTEPYGRKTASGVPNYVPGIALPSRSGLGKMHEVTTPDGRTFMLPQTDIGPAARTGRGIDISASAAEQMGYSKKDFPTDQPFSYRRIDERIAGAQKVDGQVHVQIHSDGTAARAKTKTNGDLFQKTSIQSYKQMQPTSAPAGRVNADASTLPAQVGN
jgi:hypothetical protein